LSRIAIEPSFVVAEDDFALPALSVTSKSNIRSFAGRR